MYSHCPQDRNAKVVYCPARHFKSKLEQGYNMSKNVTKVIAGHSPWIAHKLPVLNWVEVVWFGLSIFRFQYHIRPLTGHHRCHVK
jgi:hypothetical protein